MRDVVICEPVRTAVGGFGGSFKTVHAHEMASHVISELMTRTGLPAEAVEDCLFAQCYPTMEAPALRAHGGAGRWPHHIDGWLPDRPALRLGPAGGHQCDHARSGPARMILVIAGGAESMSNAPFFSIEMRWGLKGERADPA